MMTVDISTWDTKRDLRVYALPDGRGLYTNGVAAIVTPRAIDGAEIAGPEMVTAVTEWLAAPVIARNVRDAILAALPAEPEPTPPKPDAEKCRACDDTGEAECACCEGEGSLECDNPACGRAHECRTCDGTGSVGCDDCDTKPAKEEPIRSVRVNGCAIDVRYLATLRGMGPCEAMRRAGGYNPMVFDDGASVLVVMPLLHAEEVVGEVTL